MTVSNPAVKIGSGVIFAPNGEAFPVNRQRHIRGQALRGLEAGDKIAEVLMMDWTGSGARAFSPDRRTRGRFP